MGNNNSNRLSTHSNISVALAQPSSRSLHIPEDFTEQFILIWLDASCDDNSLDTLRTKTLFRELNNDRCLFINNPEQFLSQIELIHTENKKILVVISGYFATKILPRTRDILSTIFIFCQDYNKYNHLVKEYPNVIDICTEYEALKNCIQRELPSLKFNLFANQRLKSLRSLDNQYNNTYFSYMSFINALKQMPRTKHAKNIMLDKCKDFYRGDQIELNRIESFRTTYTPDQAIDWYVKDAFVYRLINRAFRTEDVTLWYLFRFYISDLCTQLEKVYKQQNIQRCLTLYRGQPQLPISEVENLKSNIGSLISSNGFLSASKYISTAQGFNLGSTHTDTYKVVIFEILLDAANLKNVVFVDVDEYTNKPHESEILFNIGSVFKVLEVCDEDSDVCKIRMQATDEGTQSIKERLDTMQKKFQNGNINLLFGRLLFDMKQYTKAESYFQMMSHVLPKYHEDLSSVYDHLGDLNMQITDWNQALKNFSLAYEIKQKKYSSTHPEIGVSLNNLGNYYKAIGEYQKALEYYSKALNCQNNQFNQAITILNISSISLLKKDYQTAFDSAIEAREIFDANSFSTYIPIIQCQGIIGSIYLAQKDYEIAEEYYLTALEMSKKHLFIDDRYRITCIKALVNLYHQETSKEKAIEFALEQLNFYEQYLTDNHINIAHLLMIMAEVYEDNEQEKLILLEKALKILVENIYVQYAATAECLMMIGKHYNRVKTYYRRALEIQKKIYPKDHSILLKTEDLIKSIED